MYVSPNLQNFYRTKQAGLMDYLKSMGMGAAIGGGAGALGGGAAGYLGGDLLDSDEYQDITGDISSSLGDLPGDPISDEVLAKIDDFLQNQVKEDRGSATLLGAGAGGLGGVLAGGAGGLGYQALKDLLFSGDKEAQVKRAALGEEDLASLKALIEEIEQEKRVKRKSGPKYGQRFLRGAAFGAPYGGLLGGMAGIGAGSEHGNELAGAGIGGGLGLLLGGGAGGLANMLGAYMQGDLYDRIAEV